MAEAPEFADENNPDLQSLEQRVEAAAKLIDNLDDERSAYNQSVNNLVDLVEQSIRQKRAENERHEALMKDLVAENERLKLMIGKLLGAVEARPSEGRSNEIADVQGRLSKLVGPNQEPEAPTADVVPISGKAEEPVEADGSEEDAAEGVEVDDTEAAVLAAMNGALAAINETAPKPAATSQAAQSSKGKRAKGGSWFS